MKLTFKEIMQIDPNGRMKLWNSSEKPFFTMKQEMKYIRKYIYNFPGNPFWNKLLRWHRFPDSFLRECPDLLLCDHIVCKHYNITTEFLREIYPSFFGLAGGFSWSILMDRKDIDIKLRNKWKDEFKLKSWESFGVRYWMERGSEIAYL